jgi:hypothetical protein
VWGEKMQELGQILIFVFDCNLGAFYEIRGDKRGDFGTDFNVYLHKGIKNNGIDKKEKR